jgi:hypothetical protein
LIVSDFLFASDFFNYRKRSAWRPPSIWQLKS